VYLLGGFLCGPYSNRVMPLRRNDGSYIQLQAIDTDTAGMAGTVSRPQAFSDSFLIIPQGSPKTPTFDVQFSAIRPRFDCQWWAEKVISILLHISLISMFETVFFFTFVSSSEDTALLRAIGGFIGGFDQTCSRWPANETAIFRDIALALVDLPAVSSAAAGAAAARLEYNSALLRQSWAYFGGLAGITTLLIGVATMKRYKIHWRRIFAENVALVGLLGVYEYVFFRTIVYNYTSLTSSELKWHLIEQVNASCAIF
jgi:hypothetical protein